MKQSSLPRVVYCGDEDAFLKKLRRYARHFILEARPTNFLTSPQSFAKAKRAAVLVLKIKNQFDLRHQEWLSKNDASVPLIVVCQNGTVETAIHALQYGAYDYFCVGQSVDTVGTRIEEALLWKSVKSARLIYGNEDQLLAGQHAGILEINQRAAVLARDTKPIVIAGEIGTGKEHLAHSIFRLSGLKHHNLLRYDCRLLRQISQYDNLSVSSLIQIQMQALKKNVPRPFLFLNHLEKLTEEQQREVFDNTISWHVRLLASYEENGKQISAEDFERHAALLRIPAVRNRKEDIPILVHQFMKRAAERAAVRPKLISEDVIRLMQNYTWPGNVQELYNIVERMMLLEPSPILTAESWHLCLAQSLPVRSDGTNPFAAMIEGVLNSSDPGWKKGALYDEFMERMEKILIRLVMTKVNNNQATAAKILGISRNTLRHKIKTG